MSEGSAGWQFETQSADESCEGALFWQKKKHSRLKLAQVPVPSLEYYVTDTHAHLHFLDKPALQLARAAVWGIDGIYVIVDSVADDLRVLDCCDTWRNEAKQLVVELLKNAEDAYGKDALPAFADDFQLTIPEIHFVLGCHPHNAKHFDEYARKRLVELLELPQVCALGEIGLDFHYDFSPREAQRKAFSEQIEIAKKRNIPMVLHLREAHAQAFSLLKEQGFLQSGVLLHCYNLDRKTLSPWLDEGIHVAFGGALTFASNDFVRDAAQFVPDDLVHLETDSPYMTPSPMRGLTCTPAHIIFSAERLAEIKNATPGKRRKNFLETLCKNARNFFASKAQSLRIETPDYHRLHKKRG